MTYEEITCSISLRLTISSTTSLGILIKSADAIDVLHKASAAVLDKTGTITEGKMRVSDVYAVQDSDESLLLTAAVSLESMSEHPIGTAIVEYGECFKGGKEL